MRFYTPEAITGAAKRYGVNVLPAEVSRNVWECPLEDGALQICFRYVRLINKEIGNNIVRVRETIPLGDSDYVDRGGVAGTCFNRQEALPISKMSVAKKVLVDYAFQSFST